jgi:hypothetical protein
LANPNSTFDQILSTTLRNFINAGTFEDQVFNGFRTTKVFKDKGVFQDEPGGESICVTLMYAQNTTVGAIGDTETYPMFLEDHFTTAQYNWRQIAGTCVITDKERAQNQNKHQILNLIKGKIQVLTESAGNYFNQMLWNAGTNPLEPVGLRSILATTGTIGGIARSSNSWWQANVDSTSEALSITDMVSIFNVCTHNKMGSNPDMIITTRALYEKYEQLAQGFQQITQTGTADLGFSHLQFKGVPLWFDDHCPSGHMAFLNSKFLKVVQHSDWKWKQKSNDSPNQPLSTHSVQWFGAICPTNCRMLGLLSGKS